MRNSVKNVCLNEQILYPIDAHMTIFHTLKTISIDYKRSDLSKLLISHIFPKKKQA